MRRFRNSRWYAPTPKKPPPERGIRMQKAGTTWWGQRWIEALEGVLGGDSARLTRGRTYARAGRTHDLVIRDGEVSAKVTGSRSTPYSIAIRLLPLSDAAWQKVIRGLAEQAQFAAELLAGQMPQQIDAAFRPAGASLFPAQRRDLTTSCTCPDWGDPCKHVAATHYVLGEALDRDPFLLFELRGRTKQQVLDALRAARSGTRKAGGRAPVEVKDEVAVPTVQLGKVKAADYDRARQPLPALQFTFAMPATPGAVLRQLGTPASWDGIASPAEMFEPLVRGAAEMARGMASGEGGETADPRPAPRTRAPRRSTRPG